MIRTDSQQAALDRYEANLTSGEVLRLIGRSNRSVPLGRPPIAASGYSGVIGALARFAGSGDWAASIAFPAIHRVNLYVTVNEVIAQVAESLAKSAADGYYDVIGATGPEASRPSAHQHPTTLRQGILLALLMIEVEMSAGWIGHAPGIGWCLEDLMDRENMTVPAHLFPALARAQAERLAKRGR